MGGRRWPLHSFQVYALQISHGHDYKFPTEKMTALIWIRGSPLHSQLPPTSVSNLWLPVGERDPFLEQGVYCTSLWAEHTPQQIFTGETDRCRDKRKCQPTAAPSSGVAGWAGWNPTIKSHPQAEQQHLTDSLGDSNTSLKRVINSFLHLSSLLTYQYVVISYHFSAFFGNSLWPTLPTGAIVLVVQVPVFWCKYAQTCVRNKMLSSLWSAFHFLILVPFCGLPSKGWTKWYYLKTECENKCKFPCGSRQVRPEVNLGHTLNQFFYFF